MICKDCGQPTNRHPKAWYCEPCRRRRANAASRRWELSPRGRLRNKITDTSEARYARVRAYRASHPDIVKKWRDAYNARRRKGPVTTRCQTELCPNLITRTARQNALKFCRECAAVFYGWAYIVKRAA